MADPELPPETEQPPARGGFNVPPPLPRASRGAKPAAEEPEARHEEDGDFNRGCMTCLTMTLLFFAVVIVSIIFSRVSIPGR